MSNLIDKFKVEGGLFDVGTETGLEKYIGMKIKKKRDDNSFWGKRVYVIKEIQKIYDGSLAFRVYQCEDLVLTDKECQKIGEKPGYVYSKDSPAAQFGEPAILEECIFVD